MLLLLSLTMFGQMKQTQGDIGVYWLFGIEYFSDAYITFQR